MYKFFLYSSRSKNGYISSSGLEDIEPSALILEDTDGITVRSRGTIISQIIGPS